ncbi:DUF7144 family membrane protein [Streptomyces sp. C10-9-1]|uniref:DUF7144 family membrane protein n=1 Tax=Streptomyces sp. C10-9-1 TaxID=1859285 RepID=UPI003D73022B
MGRHTAPDAHGAPDGYPRMVGGLLFAGVLMLGTGVLAVLQGVAALVGGEVYTRVDDGYLYGFSPTGWGWVHIALGALIALTGWGVLGDAAWARLPGLLFASLGLVAQFAYLPYQPVWSVVLMAAYALVLRALAVRRDTARR